MRLILGASLWSCTADHIGLASVQIGLNLFSAHAPTGVFRPIPVTRVLLSFFTKAVVSGAPFHQKFRVLSIKVPGALNATTGANLANGVDGTPASSNYSNFLTAIEPYKFDVLIYDGSDATVQNAMVAFVKRMNEEAGTYTQLVAAGLTNPRMDVGIPAKGGLGKPIFDKQIIQHAPVKIAAAIMI